MIAPGDVSHAPSGHRLQLLLASVSFAYRILSSAVRPHSALVRIAERESVLSCSLRPGTGTGRKSPAGSHAPELMPRRECPGPELLLAAGSSAMRSRRP